MARRSLTYRRPGVPRRAGFWPATIACFLVLGCGGCDKGKTKAARAAQETPHPPPAVADDGTAALPVPPGEPVTFDEALKRVERVRGLKSKRPVQGLVVDSAALRDHLERALVFERPEEVMRGTEAMLVGLGLVEPRFDFKKTIIALLEENLAGLYEPRLNLMMVRRDLPESAKQITLDHELVHALQDQYFDLDEIVTANADDSDKSSALSALAEGDATSAMLDAILPAGKTALDLPEGSIEAQFFAQAPKTDAPALIIRSLYAPYLDGLHFVHALRQRGGFAAVNEAFLHPPSSTEQLLHLDKYDAHEAPIPVPIPPPPRGDPWKLTLHDIWGEQSLRLALEEWVDPEVAARAAAGWGGDRIAAYERGEQIAVVWDMRMDDAAQAEELMSSLQPRETPSAETVPSTADSPLPCRYPDGPGPPLAFGRSGSRVVLAGAPFDRTLANGTCADAQRWVATLLGQTVQ